MGPIDLLTGEFEVREDRLALVGVAPRSGRRTQHPVAVKHVDRSHGVVRRPARRRLFLAWPEKRESSSSTFSMQEAEPARASTAQAARRGIVDAVTPARCSVDPVHPARTIAVHSSSNARRRACVADDEEVQRRGPTHRGCPRSPGRSESGESFAPIPDDRAEAAPKVTARCSMTSMAVHHRTRQHERTPGRFRQSDAWPRCGFLRKTVPGAPDAPTFPSGRPS